MAVRRHGPARLQTGGGAVLALLRSQRVVALLTWRPTALPDCPNSSILAHTECFKIAVNSSGLLQEVRCSFRLKYPQGDQLKFSFHPIFNHIGVSASTMSPPYFINCPLAVNKKSITFRLWTTHFLLCAKGCDSLLPQSDKQGQTFYL